MTTMTRKLKQEQRKNIEGKELYLNNIWHANEHPNTFTNDQSYISTKFNDMSTLSCIAVPNPNCSVTTAREKLVGFFRKCDSRDSLLS